MMNDYEKNQVRQALNELNGSGSDLPSEVGEAIAILTDLLELRFRPLPKKERDQ